MNNQNQILDELSGFSFFCHFDHFWTMVSLSDGFKSVTGYDPRGCISNKLFSYADIIDSDDQKKVLDHIAISLIQDKPYEIIYRIRTIDDKVITVLEKGKGIKIDGLTKHIKGLVLKIENYPIFIKNMNYLIDHKEK